MHILTSFQSRVVYTIPQFCLLFLGCCCIRSSSLVSAFVQPVSPISVTSRLSVELPNLKLFSRRSVATPLSAAAITVPNPFKQLPWNIKKEREREMRRSRIERAKLYRQLGIAEDATYEELVQATDRLLLLAGSNLKQKIQIEMTKDQILQHRLKERLNGLMQSTEKEARAMSDYEIDGIDDDDLPKAVKEWNAPRWTQNLIVKPNREHVMNQARLWGILTALGIALPPVQDYLGRFTWLICIAQLTFRGMPKQDVDGGGMGMSFNEGRGGGHRKVAFALGLTTWVVGAVLAYGLMPTWARGQRWTGSAAFAIQNLIFALASCYLQPYKG